MMQSTDLEKNLATNEQLGALLIISPYPRALSCVRRIFSMRVVAMSSDQVVRMKERMGLINCL